MILAVFLITALDPPFAILRISPVCKRGTEDLEKAGDQPTSVTANAGSMAKPSSAVDAASQRGKNILFPRGKIRFFSLVLGGVWTVG